MTTTAALRQLTADDGQTVTDVVEYSPYGRIVHRSGDTDTPFLYNGMYGVMTSGNGLLHMRARFYNPYTRRFINADPIGFAGGMNWYAFAGSNPISNIDPAGLSETSTAERLFAATMAPFVYNAIETRKKLANGIEKIKTLGNAHKTLKLSGSDMDLGPVGSMAELVATDNSAYLSRGYGGSIVAGNSASHGYALNFNLLEADFSIQEFKTRSDLDVGMDLDVQSVKFGLSSVPLDQTSSALNLSYGLFGYSAIGGGEHSGQNALAHEFSLSIGSPFGASYSLNQETNFIK